MTRKSRSRANSHPLPHTIALIHKALDSCYGVSFPDVPGVAAVADTLDAALHTSRVHHAPKLQYPIATNEFLRNTFAGGTRRHAIHSQVCKSQGLLGSLGY